MSDQICGQHVYSSPKKLSKRRPFLRCLGAVRISIISSSLVGIFIIFMCSGIAVAMEESEPIKVYDKEGKEYLIPRDSYRKDVLPEIFEKAWNDEDALYSAIVTTLRDEFYSDALASAIRFQEISKSPESSAVLLGITYNKLGRLKEARETLEKYLKNYGDSGVVLTNLAKVIADEGGTEKSLEVLWKSLTVDPNQDNALDWWSAIHYEKGGAGARIDSIKKVAEIPGSWRPQLWLARDYLETGDKSNALAIYQEILSTNAASHGDVLMMITGDLGNNGHLSEAIGLIAPVYNPQKHGIETGINLVMAYKQLKLKKQGLALLNQLGAQERYDWMEYLNQLRHELSGI
jgi:tetratricopeptide (TPR) repeat protein